ncbi:MAG: hypothetical protein ACQCN5_04685 [Candidatus Bathyarchaeia archaeon]|jgi:hypothetical protein
MAKKQAISMLKFEVYAFFLIEPVQPLNQRLQRPLRRLWLFPSLILQKRLFVESFQ